MFVLRDGEGWRWHFHLPQEKSKPAALGFASHLVPGVPAQRKAGTAMLFEVCLKREVLGFDLNSVGSLLSK